MSGEWQYLLITTFKVKFIDKRKTGEDMRKAHAESRQRMFLGIVENERLSTGFCLQLIILLLSYAMHRLPNHFHLKTPVYMKLSYSKGLGA